MILGSEGFLGKSVCHELLSHTKSLIIKVDRIMPLKESPRAQCFKVDITRTREILKLCDRSCPDVIFNFTGTYDTTSKEKLFRINCLAPIKLLEASVGKRFRLVLMGSAAEYGPVSGKIKVKEDFPLSPISDYGISKACQTLMALSIARKNSWPQVVIARGFNIIGPGVSSRLFLGAFALQIAKIENGLQPPILRVGNLESYRDLLPVTLFSRYVRFLAENRSPSQVYNVCTGRPTKIKTVLEKLLSISNVKNIKIISKEDDSQSSDITWSVGDCSKLSRFIKISVSESDFIDTLHRTLDWYRDMVSANER